MHISCEKCATTYLLDDSLIPPQGAPVQCTRCGHVFTARVPNKDLASTQPGPPQWDAHKKVGNSTMAFGQPAPAAAPPPAANQTMMFGAPASSSAPPQPAGKQTMVFGAPGAPSAPAQPASKQTMVFGAPGAASAQPASKQTMVFGAPGAASAPAQPASKQTMVFGAPGAAAPSAQPASKQTMVFGAPGAAAPPAQPASKQTMVFGAPAASPAPAQPASKQTMVFGAPAVSPAPAPAQPAGKQTMVFGAVAPTGAPPAAPSRNQTMMFGRAPGSTPAPRVTASVTAGSAGEEVRERSESTVRVDLEAMMRGQGAEDFEAVQARHDSTQRYAMSESGPTPEAPRPAESPEAVQARHNRTSLYAMSSQQETTKPDANVPPVAGPNVADWGHRPGDSTLPPSFAEMPTLEPDAAPPPQPAVNQTLVFGAQGPRAHVTTDPGLDPPGVRVLLEPGMMTPPEGAEAAQREPIATTLPNLSPIERGESLPPLRVDLPPEPAFAAHAQTERALPVPSAQDDAAMAEMRRASSRRTAIAVIVFLVVALGLGLAVLWHLFGRSLLSGQGDAAAKSQVEAAVVQLRMDDAESRQKAIGELEGVLATNPELIDAQAGLVLAEAFAFDDADVLLSARQDLAKHGRATPEAVAESKDRRSKTQAALKASLGRLERARAALQPGAPEGLIALRASAVAYGVLGEPKALELEEAYRQASPAPDDWLDLAMPEYVATQGSTIVEALKQLEAVAGRPSNSTFFRVLVLRARLFIKAGDAVAAEELLKTVTTLNSKHEVAAVLLEQLTQSREQPPSTARKPGLDR